VEGAGVRPKHCVVDNFGSYEHAEISFDNLGLTLISGPTGAGKSTIADFVAWGLFGVTSKNGAADDVRAWGSDQPTKVELEVELPEGTITVTRIRGKQTQNDLFWREESYPEKEVRGKDLTETQRLLEQRLGVDAELFLLGSYFSQFSQTDAFFTAKPKDRRETLERITDLSLPVTLAERASEARKLAKKELETLESSLTKEQGRQEQLISQRQSLERAYEGWNLQHDRMIAEVQEKSESFESEKATKIEELVSEIETLAAKVQSNEPLTDIIEQNKCRLLELAEVRVKYQKQLAVVSDVKAGRNATEKEHARQEKLPDTCPECKRPGVTQHREKHLDKLRKAILDLTETFTAEQKQLSALERVLATEPAIRKTLADAEKALAANNRLRDRLEAEEKALVALDESVNPYLDRLEQLQGTSNPHKDQISDTVAAIAAVEQGIKRLEQSVAEKSHRVASLSSIYDLSFALRGELLQNAVGQLERATNENLQEYFDGVFSVSFVLEGSDKLEVTVSKEGHEVAYAQLSGGERRQLVLSFWRALSKRAWECAGVTSSLLVMDEAFSGLDDTLKEKAFRMLEDMSDEFESILVIDHSPAFQMMFSRTIEVTKQGENSVLGDVADSEAAA
jgi:DNA repair exonuclease SbcCD ATPase subunit